MVTLELGWILVTIAAIFAVSIWIFGWLIGRRMDRIRERVRAMSKDVERMNIDLQKDAKRLDELKRMSKRDAEDLR